MRRLSIFVLVGLLAPGLVVAQDYPRYPALGSTFVPLDSWVYPPLERLAGLGYVSTAMMGLKPWTRTECARLTEEAGQALTEAVREDRPPEEFVVRMHSALEREFAYELEALAGGRQRAFRLESVYTRVLSISGPPLTDGFHLGQTISYDFGRPFRRGANAVAGASAHASAGPVALYFRGEFQHAPSAPALSSSALDLIALRDNTPREIARRFEPVNRWRLLDAYASFNLRNWQLSVGKQSLSWGPGAGGSLLLSNNAEPLDMVRLTRVLPFKLPGFLRILGPLRVEQFVGRPHGYTVNPGAYLYGQKISAKLTPYLEMGFGRTAVIGGRGGDPLTARNLFRNFFGLRPGSGANQKSAPGHSRVSLDWTLRIPGLHNYVVLYNEMYGDDNALTYAAPTRAAFHPGLYLTRFPGLPKLDFRIEATSTESPGFQAGQGHLNYWNFRYRDGYRNNGFLLGNTVGRQGRAVQLWSTYWFSPTHTLQFSFKQSRVDEDFIPQGGNWRDYSVRHEIHLRSRIYVRSYVQLEQIGHYPFLFTGTRNNFTASVEFGFAPEQPRP